MPVARVVLLGIAACAAPRPADLPLLPPNPEVRIAVAQLVYAGWHGEHPRFDVRLQIRDWLSGWHGVSLVPDDAVDATGEFVAGTIIGHGQQAPEAQATVAAACRAARELGVDAVVYGNVRYGETPSLRCLREESLFDKSPQCAEFGELESMRSEASVRLVVVHRATCGFNEVVLDAQGKSRDPERSYAQAWSEVRLLARKHVPDAVRTAPAHRAPAM